MVCAQVVTFHSVTVSLTWDCVAVRGVALQSLRHSSVVVGDNIYVYGGVLGGNPTNDLLVFNTGPNIIAVFIEDSDQFTY